MTKTILQSKLTCAQYKLVSKLFINTTTLFMVHFNFSYLDIFG